MKLLCNIVALEISIDPEQPWAKLRPGGATCGLLNFLIRPSELGETFIILSESQTDSHSRRNELHFIPSRFNEEPNTEDSARFHLQSTLFSTGPSCIFIGPLCQPVEPAVAPPALDRRAVCSHSGLAALWSGRDLWRDFTVKIKRATET